MSCPLYAVPHLQVMLVLFWNWQTETAGNNGCHQLVCACMDTGYQECLQARKHKTRSLDTIAAFFILPRPYRVRTLHVKRLPVVHETACSKTFDKSAPRWKTRPPWFLEPLCRLLEKKLVHDTIEKCDMADAECCLTGRHCSAACGRFGHCDRYDTDASWA